MNNEIYVKEKPKSCVGCKHFAEHRRQCNLELCLQWSEEKFKFNDCPLIDIKTHDRELVKEVCEKIRKTIASTVDLAESNQQIKDQFNIILDLIQKEYEK